MKGETAELSKLMQNKREEKTTLRKEVFTKKERGERRRLRRKENAKVSAQNFDAAVQVQVAPKPGDNLFKAIAETEVVAAVVCMRPGVNLFREVKKRGRPPKELLQEQEAQVLQKLYRLTATDKKFVLVSLDAILDSILSQREGEKEKKIKVPTKKAIEKAAAKAADKKAAEDATTKAAAGAADADKKSVEETNTETVGPEPEVKEIAEPKEAEAETVEQEPTCGLCTEPTPEVCTEDCWECMKLSPEVKEFAAVYHGRPGTCWPPELIRIHWEEFEACMDEFSPRWRGSVNLMYKLQRK